MSATLFGVTAAFILFLSFALRGEKKIRLVNMVGCAFLVMYGIKLEGHNLILILLGATTIIIHLVQFRAMWKDTKSAKAVAKAEARAAEAEAKVAPESGVPDDNQPQN